MPAGSPIVRWSLGWWLALAVVALLSLAACTSDSDGASTNGDSEAIAGTDDERNTIAVAEQFGPSTAALSVQVGGQLMLGDVAAPTGGPVQQSSGSGFVIEVAGERFIVTNFHVVESTLEPNTSNLRGDAVITAAFGEEESMATSLNVVGVNPSFDLALLEATDGDEIPEVEPIPIGDSDDVQFGQKTIVIGNPFGFGASITTGIVSSTERFIQSVGGVDIPMLQTDAAINPGNSGGAMLSSSGELIGINTAIFNPEAGAFAGIGFAVPSNLLSDTLVNLETGGVTMLSDVRPAFGAQLGNLAGLPPAIRTEAGLPDSGIAVLDVDPDGPAADAGIRVPEFQSVGGLAVPVNPDIIIAIDGEPVPNADALNELITFGSDLGEEVVLTIRRDGEDLEVSVSLN